MKNIIKPHPGTIEEDVLHARVGDGASLRGLSGVHDNGLKQSPLSATRMMFIAIGIAVAVGASSLLLNKQPAKVHNTGRGNRHGGIDGKDRKAPVTVATAQQQLVPIQIRSIGNVLPYSVVNIVPQVGGQLQKVFFTQGDFVKKGDLLFQIDSSPYEATVAQAEGNVQKDKALIQQAEANLSKDEAQVGLARANLMKDQATQKYAHTELGRYSTLLAQGAVSREQTDQMSTNVYTANAVIAADNKAIENAMAVLNADKAAIATAKGTLAADQAAAKSARIQLSWTQIRAPIDGRTSSLNVYPGNVVSAASSSSMTTNPLVTIAQVKPIYVNFTVPEQNLDIIRKNLQSKQLKVEAQIGGKKRNAVLGNVSFLENTVNTQTGTVTLRAEFPNVDMHLFPGQFVNVIVTMPPEASTVTVPTTALQTTQSGTAVYVVKEDNTATFTPVQVARTNGDITAITTGISAGDIVVTDGQLQLTPDIKVQIVKDQHNKEDHSAKDDNHSE